MLENNYASLNVNEIRHVENVQLITNSTVWYLRQLIIRKQKNE